MSSFHARAVGTQAAGRAVNHARPGVRRQHFQNVIRQHVAALRLLVAQNSVEQELNGPPVVNAQKQRALVRAFGHRLAGFREENIVRQVRDFHGGRDLPALIKQRLGQSA